MAEYVKRSGQMFEENKGGLPKKTILGSVKGAVDGLFKPLKGKTPSTTGAKPSVSSLIMEAALNIHKVDLKTVNQVLILALVGLTGSAFYYGLSEPPDIKALKAAVSEIRYEPPEETTITSFEELPAYLDQIKTRDIFNEYQEPKPPAPVVKKPEPPPPPPPPKVTIQEKAKDLTLMGVSWGESPKAMIKNAATGEVLFLEEGQKVKGTEIEIKSIDKRKVIIASDGDEMKLL